MDAEAARWEAAHFAKKRKGNPLIIDLGFLCGPLRERPERAPFAALCVKVSGLRAGNAKDAKAARWEAAGQFPVPREKPNVPLAI